MDNASLDQTVAVARSVEGVCVIANRENLGFAGGVNRGFRATTARFLLLLNPDVELATTLEPLITACEQHGMATGRLLDHRTGKVQRGFNIRSFPTPGALIFEILGTNRLWRSNPVNRRFRYLDRDPEAEGLADQPAGCFLMTRRDIFEELGGFDEGFHPIWFEDTDYCRRAADLGFRAMYLPGVAACHRGGHSIALVDPGCRVVQWYVSLLRYAAKHFGWFGYRGVTAAVILGSIPRMIVGWVSGRESRGLRQLTTYGRIVRYSTMCFLSRKWCLSSKARSPQPGDLVK